MRSLGALTMSLTYAVLLHAGLHHVALADRTVADTEPFSPQTRVVWDHPTVEYEIATSNLPGTLSVISSAIREGFAPWEALECGFYGFTFTGTVSSAVSGDGRNTIEWITSGWQTYGYPSSAMAVSEVVYGHDPSDGTWSIREADLYVNGADYRWGSNANDTSSNLRSIQAMITHESGHWLGILHPCETDGSLDVENCAQTPAYASTVMYPLYDGMGRLSLDIDDLNALCRQYPPIQCSKCQDEETCIKGVCIKTNLSDPECVSSSDCGNNQECLWGVCLGLLPPGTPCDSAEDCRFAHCSTSKICRPTCGDPRCAVNEVCIDDDGLVLCNLEGALFAERCTRGAECLSRLCILESETDGACTHTCDTDRQCPNSYRCDAVAGVDVCVSRTLPQGCNTTTNEPSTAIPIFILILALVYARRSQKTRKNIS